MSLSLRQLRAFLAVADAQSFTGAADQLNLTQSAVSMLIRQLEADLNIALFVRSGRGAHLTEFGTSIRPTAMRVLSDVQNINDAAADLRSLQRGHLRIAIPQVLGCCWLPSVLGAFRQQYPDVEVSISETAGDGVTDLVGRGDVEIGIGPERPLVNGVVADKMWDVPMQLIVSRHASHLRDNKPPTLRELQKMYWINYSDDFSELLHRTLLGNPGSPRTQDIRVLGLMSAMAIIGQENYVTAAPAYANIFAGVFGVRFLPLAGPASKRRFLHYVRDKHDLSPAAATFLEMARNSGPVESMLDR
ncbi:Cyn operon transcriptional activator [Thalassovita gelatinovora]|uniref:Cyn operon transcriptional activator n=1 Tax=Thalassovita gelatinovora TaxID=53501 RepID=A0A0N7LUI8_THAGE|nr:LysR family transcriptional regulator [Thalassovita gelatinovora]QIZ79162.1 LysR family transcriptional regulator [Thalassovita gelatinovora]CUH63618.1 Cyn operon transcriptional activator [Thalassovita gelatinovora]SER00568.1 transcriptional regulator, LysR family [Thalassovita gelatinovora]